MIPKVYDLGLRISSMFVKFLMSKDINKISDFFSRNSTSARIMYALLLLLTTVVSCILLAPGLHEKLKSVPFCKGLNDEESGGDTNFLDKVQNELQNTFADPISNSVTVDCSQVVGYLAVYR